MRQRHRLSRLGRWTFLASTIVGIVALSALLFNVIDQSFGLVAVEAKIDPASLAVDGVPLEDLSQDQLTAILQAHVSSGLLRRLEDDQPLAERTRDDVYRPGHRAGGRTRRSSRPGRWPTRCCTARRDRGRGRPRSTPRRSWRSGRWVNPAFIGAPQSSNPLLAGVRTAILGSLWMIALTILLAPSRSASARPSTWRSTPRDTWLNRIIQTNINNLAGVPSIIYGMLGLAIFVRAAGAADQRRRCSARCRPHDGQRPHDPLRRADPGAADPAAGHHQRPGGDPGGAATRCARPATGWAATKWQTIWHHVLPNAIAGHPDRHDPGRLARHRRDRAAGRGRRLHLHHLRSHRHRSPSSPPCRSRSTSGRPGRRPSSATWRRPPSWCCWCCCSAMNAAAILLRNRYGRQGRYL